MGALKSFQYIALDCISISILARAYCRGRDRLCMAAAVEMIETYVEDFVADQHIIVRIQTAGLCKINFHDRFMRWQCRVGTLPC
jgi:hypothetical protein